MEAEIIPVIDQRNQWGLKGRPQLKVNRESLATMVKCLAHDPAERTRFVSDPDSYLGKLHVGHVEFTPRGRALYTAEACTEVAVCLLAVYLGTLAIQVNAAATVNIAETINYCDTYTSGCDVTSAELTQFSGGIDMV